MSIKLAMSTVACPQWSLDEVLKQTKALGYDAVELRTLGEGGTRIASDPMLSDSAKVGQAFADAGVEPLCLATSLALHHRDAGDARHALFEVERHLEAAAAMGCRYVRVFGNEVRPGEDRRSVIDRIAQRLPRLADKAGDLGLQLLFENAGSFAKARDWWAIFNQMNHPMARMCWNVANAAAAGEDPSVSVPMLHSRIAIAKVKDARLGTGSGYVQLGEGDCQVEHFIRRLCGIGFEGAIVVEWDRAWLGDALEPAESYLPEAATRLRAWLDDITMSVRDPKAWAKQKLAAAKA